MRIKYLSAFRPLFVTISLLLSIIILSSQRVHAVSSFITTWNTANEGGSASNQVSIPVNGSSTYNYFVDWGDGKTDSNVNGGITHTYDTPGIYTVKISGTFPRIQFSNGGDKKKILSVEQWGDIVWTSTEAAFYGASNLVINAQDTPNLSHVKNASYMFQDAKSIDGGLENWDVSSIEVFGRMFSGASKFNGDISRWNMSNAFNTEYMFAGATSFNRDISGWNMSHAGIMRGMFSGAVTFNRSLNSWTLSKAFNVEDIFRNASSYDQSFGSWNIGSIQYIQGLLSGASLSTNVYDSLLTTWSQTQTAHNVKIDAGNSTYCKGVQARDYLVNHLGWIINDMGADTVFCGAVEVNFVTVPTLQENQPADTLVGRLAVQSSLGGNFTMSLSCTPESPDSKYFELRGDQIFTKSTFDYEKPLDKNADNAYEICVRISNESGQSTQKFVLVTVGDIEDSPQDGGGQGNGSGNNGGGNNSNGNGQVLGSNTGGSVLASTTGKVLAATGIAIGLVGIYIGLGLAGITTLGFRRKKPLESKADDLGDLLL